MARVHTIFASGVLAVCVIAACSGVARAQATNKIEADLRDQFAVSAPLGGGRTSLYAYSKQDPPVTKGPNNQVTTELTSNGVMMMAPSAQSLNAQSNNIVVIAKDGKKAIYGPPLVALRNQPKSPIKILGDIEGLQSRSDAYSGLAAQLNLGAKAGGRQISALASVDRSAGPVPSGSAAGAALDPFTVPSGSSFDYGPTIDATLQLINPSVFGGIEFYALDSTVLTTDAVDNFIEDGSPFEDTLWTLSLTADRPLGSTSAVQVDFELNPDALKEILLPSSYLLSLPGFSTGLGDPEITELVEGAIDNATSQGLTFDNGAASLGGFALFPVGTQFQPTGSDVVYAEGANAVLTAVPEPATLLLIGAGLLGLASVSSKRHNRRSCSPA